MNVADLRPNYSVFGNKGNVWSNTAHIYEGGKGNMCGTPALSTNWAKIEDVSEIGCPICLNQYKAMEDEYTDFERQLEHMTGGHED